MPNNNDNYNLPKLPGPPPPLAGLIKALAPIPIDANQYHKSALDPSAWPTDSEADNPSPSYLAMHTEGPLTNASDVKYQLDQRFDDAMRQRREADRLAERRLHNQLDSPAYLKPTGNR